MTPEIETRISFVGYFQIKAGILPHIATQHAWFFKVAVSFRRDSVFVKSARTADPDDDLSAVQSDRQLAASGDDVPVSGQFAVFDNGNGIMQCTGWADVNRNSQQYVSWLQI